MIASPPARLRGRLTILGVLAMACAACFIPDRDIQVNDESITNRSPVRIVEAVQISDEALTACDDSDPLLQECPQPQLPEDVLPHFLDPDISEFAFCSCPPGSTDAKARPNFPIYIEDRDENPDADDGDRLDEIYAALILDYNASNHRPFTSVRYRTYINPQEPVPLAGDITYQPIGRHGQKLRELRLGNENLDFDFCNGATDTALDPGFHTLTVIVSDRPWFTPDDGFIQEGVPDFTNAATFDVTRYVFRCNASDVEPCQSSQCISGEEL